MDILTIQNRHTGETLRMHRERDVSGRVILIVEGTLPPRTNGPPPHVHFQEREEGAVEAGTLGAQIGGQMLVVEAGGNAAFPAGVVHSWWNAGETLLEFNGRVVPAVDLDQFLQALFAVLNASASNRPSIFLSGSRALAASPYAESGDAPRSDPADFVSSGPVDWPRPRQVQGTELAGMPRKLHRCSVVRSCDCSQQVKSPSMRRPAEKERPPRHQAAYL